RIRGRLSAPPIINRSHDRTTPARAYPKAPRSPFRLPVLRIKVRAGKAEFLAVDPRAVLSGGGGTGKFAHGSRRYLTNDVDRDHELGGEGTVRRSGGLRRADRALPADGLRRGAVSSAQPDGGAGVGAGGVSARHEEAAATA